MFIRYNETAKYYEYDTSPGQTGAGPWLILPIDYAQIYNPPATSYVNHATKHNTGGVDPITALSGGVINTGTVADARLSSNVALKNAANIFSQSQWLSGTAPALVFQDTDAPVNKRYSQIYADGDYFIFRQISDDFSVEQNNLFLYRDGRVFLAKGQLTFPAAQNPSSDPNTLDDYEEGVWTPSLLYGGVSSPGDAYSIRVGSYIKIGRLVNIYCSITLTNKGTGTGIATIIGIPFSSAYEGHGVMDYPAGMAGISGSPFALISGNTVYPCHAGATARLLMTEANFTNSSSIRFTITYQS